MKRAIAAGNSGDKAIVLRRRKLAAEDDDMLKNLP
jgi:hypothetical protein